MGSCFSCIRTNTRTRTRTRRGRRNVSNNNPTINTIETNIDSPNAPNTIEIDILPQLVAAAQQDNNSETNSVEPLVQAEELPQAPETPTENNTNSGITNVTQPQPRFIFLVIQRRNVAPGRPRFLVLVIDNSNNPTHNLPSIENEDDHFQNIIDQLFRLAPVRGPPPTSATYLAALPVVKLTNELLTKNPRCVICCEDFSLGQETSQLPCGHCFDKECVETWLKEHNTCCVCRHELPVDDPEYERQRKERQRNGTDSNVNSNPTTMEES